LSSGEITNAPLLLKAASTGKPLILSSGMCTLADIETALGVLAFGYLKPHDQPSVNAFQTAFRSEEGQQALRAHVTLLHCTTEYPAPFAEVNLRAMQTMAAAFGLPVGFSDHTEGIAVAIAAAARGAMVIEKHFTVDRSLPGPDHKASLEPAELQAMVRSIRHVEQALGSPLKIPAPSEAKNMMAARKSIVAVRAIKVGEQFSSDNLAVKRPGAGISPVHYWELLGRKAHRDYEADEAIE
jgi:N-acetylneuraminate synthase